MTHDPTSLNLGELEKNANTKDGPLSQKSCHHQFRTYSLKAGRERVPLPLILCDTMGLEAYGKPGLHMADIVSILKGHVPDCYQVKSQ